MAAGRQQPTYRRADAPQSPVIWIVGILVLLIMGMIVFLFLGNARGSDVPPDDGTIADGAAPSEQRVSFVAVGDNLPDITLASYADACAGVPDDGLYDYNPLYRPIKPYIEAADLAYIDFETHAGGNDIGPRGYPSFNTTDTMVDAVYDTGFDLIASATNHCYDWGQSALDHSRALWMQKPVLFAGTASTPEEAAVIPTREKNGIVFSFLNYTYGVNGYQEEDIPSWAVNYMHEDRIREDVARARESSDVVIVAMHWGTENLTEADENQRSYAQILADSGADLVLGSHPHVIGPVEWVEGSQGNKTLVAYSLGNFISHHETPDYLNELEGMLQCEFVKDQGTVRIENVAWVPLVNHSEEGAYAVYPLKDYSAELAARHRILSTLEDPLATLREASRSIVGTAVDVIVS